MMTTQLSWSTEKRKVKELVPAEYNPRQMTEKQAKELEKSLKKFGLVEIPAIDQDNTLLAGHMRMATMIQLGRGEEEIDVRVPNRKLTDAEAKEYNLRSNKNTGEWDMDKLFAMPEGLLEEVGWDKKEIQKLIDGHTTVQEDDYNPEEGLKQPVRVHLGEVWKLGSHRLMCGDSTKKDDVERLMDGEKADMVFTDPPYGMALEADYSVLSWGDRKGKKYDNVIGDHEDFKPEIITSVFENFGYCQEIFLWGADYYFNLIPDFKIGHYIVWDKTLESNGDAGSNSEFELVWTKKRHKRQVIHFNWFRYFGLQKQDMKTREHPTQKPLQVCTPFITQYSKEGSIVLDLFGGSGSTLITCEQTNRKCYMMELDPKYCTVILDRWEKLTNKKAIKL